MNILNQIKGVVINMFDYYKKLDEMGLKIYNPHCKNWKKCLGGSINYDCFGCGGNQKGTVVGIEKIKRSYNVEV